MMKARATSFATMKDMVGYIRCRDEGGSAKACLSQGDNGIGCWGDVTARLDVAMCAVPRSEMVRHWGSKNNARGKQVRVNLTQRGAVIICEVRDQAPDGIIDLNPGALIEAGMPPDTELNEPAEWEWL